MNIRNAKQRASGVIDCEIEHHELGWLPYTAREDDDSTLQVYARCLNGEAGDITDDPFPRPSYEKQRAAAYPSIADQLDAIWKGGEEMEAMRQRVLDVKARYPKQ